MLENRSDSRGTDSPAGTSVIEEHSDPILDPNLLILNQIPARLLCIVSD